MAGLCCIKTAVSGVFHHKGWIVSKRLCSECLFVGTDLYCIRCTAFGLVSCRNMFVLCQKYFV